MPDPTETLLGFFTYDHIPPGRLRETSKRFHDLAHALAETVPHSAELTVSLRKLLESKDCGVRAMLGAVDDDERQERFPDEMPVIHHGGAGGVVTYVQSTRPDGTALMEGDLWIPEAGAAPLRWSQDAQDWVPA